MASYATAAEARAVLKISAAEYLDADLNQMIDSATAEIDRRTGRTWQAVTTLTDQYYDGDGTDRLWLPQVDIGTVSALAIDDNSDGTYTTVNVTHVIVKSDIGMLKLNSEVYSSIAVTSFAKGYNTVKITYTYGNAAPTNEIKDLCIMMVGQKLKLEPGRQELIDRRLEEFRRKQLTSI